MSNIEHHFFADYAIVESFHKHSISVSPKGVINEQEIMTNIEHEQIEVLARKSVVLREAWRRERREALSRQLTENNEVKKRWELSDPIEIIERQTVNGKRRG